MHWHFIHFIIALLGSSLQAADGNDSQDHAALGPVVIMDIGDNIGGGSTADSTFLLQEAVQQGVAGFLQTLKDPAAVRECIAAGVGATLSLSVGGKTDNLHGSPVQLSCVVRRISDGNWEDDSPTHGGGRRFSAGRCAVIEALGGDVTVLLTSAQSGNTSRGQYYQAGIHPEKYRIIIAKGVQSPRPAYQPIASHVLMANTPGPPFLR